MDLHIVGSIVDPALEAVTQELNDKWIKKTDNSDLLVMYFLDEGSDWVVFVVYTDPYSGMARYAAQIPAEQFYNGELDADYIMTQFKNTWEDGSVVAEKLSKGESLNVFDDKRSQIERVENIKALINHLMEKGYTLEEAKNKVYHVDELDSAKRNYGGAYDVDPEAFFTRDDIVDFGNDICDDLTRNTACEVELAGAEISDDGGHDFLTLTIVIDDDYEVQASINIDMRRIRKPSDIYKYKNEMLVEFMDGINEYLSTEEGVDMNSSKDAKTTKMLSKEEKDAIKSLFERYGVPIEYINDAIDSDDGIEYQEYVVGVHNPSRKGYDRLMRALDNLEDEYDIGYWNDYHDEQSEVRDEIHFFHYPEEKLQSSKADSSKRKTSINCASSQVRNSVEVHVENQIENALEELMDSAISAETTAQEVADYDADWCADDYPNEIANRIDKAMEELIQASVDLLMYNAPSELKK